MFRALFVCAVSLIAQVPDAATLLKDVQAHQQGMDRLREDYTFHVISRTDDVDATGKVKSSHSMEREVFFVKGRAVSRLVKQDGIPLSPKDDEKEQRRVKKRVEELLKMQPLQPTQRRRGLLAQILDGMQLGTPSRTTWNGRNTWVFDFHGDPKRKAHGIQESLSKKMAGTIWIDEADRQVARIKVKMDDNFKIAGGLVGSIAKGTEIVIEQTPLGEGLWMQKSSDQHLDFHLMMKGTRQNVHTESFDFKKFQVGATEQK